MQGHVLIVDDERDMCEVLATALTARSFDVTWRTSAEEALRVLEQQDFDVVVTDLKMPGIGGVELCQRIVHHRPDAVVVVITAFGSLDTAIGAIRAGAYDYLTKPFEFEQLALVLQRALKIRALNQEIKRLRRVVSAGEQFDELIGDSPVMRDLFSLMARIGDASASVLITGESGTGKELVARALHRQSGREGAFVALNCAAMPESLLESELFGHTKGAFTDARSNRDGLFRKAHGGSLFLDEIGDMPVGLQAKLLRALQERTIRPLGGDREFEFDARIMAATHTDLEAACESGRFREDLYFRLNVIHIPVPPLRARGNDILLLAQRFLERFAQRQGHHLVALSRPAAERFLAYAWPGNVRELENCVERAVTLAQHDHILLEDLPEKVRDYKVTQVVAPSADPADLVSMDEVERRYIKRVMELVGGNKSQAAKILGYGRKTLYRRLQRYGLDTDAGGD